MVNGKYSDSEYVASFIGMVPTATPRSVVAVMVNRPHGFDFWRVGGGARVGTASAGRFRTSDSRRAEPARLGAGRRCTHV